MLILTLKNKYPNYNFSKNLRKLEIYLLFLINSIKNLNRSQNFYSLFYSINHSNQKYIYNLYLIILIVIQNYFYEIHIILKNLYYQKIIVNFPKYIYFNKYQTHSFIKSF